MAEDAGPRRPRETSSRRGAEGQDRGAPGGDRPRRAEEALRKTAEIAISQLNLPVLQEPRPAARARASRSARKRTSGPGWMRLIGPALALAAVVGAVFVLLPRARRALTYTVPEGTTVVPTGESDGIAVVTAGGNPAPVTFSDGTVLTLARNSRARIAVRDHTGADVRLHGGRLEAAVRAGGRWAFEAGPFRIAAADTRSEVAWDPDRRTFSLKVQEGSVLVSGPTLGGERPLKAGQTIEFSLAPPSTGGRGRAIPPPRSPAPAAAP